MKLLTFRLRNCFGFRDSGAIQLTHERNFIYILGRNSSGKSSLLNAIKYFEPGTVPSGQPNFRNFNDIGESRALIATFDVETSLSDSTFLNGLNSRFAEWGIDDRVIKINPKLGALRERIMNIYFDLVSRLNQTRHVTVWKTEDGHYHFLEEQDNTYTERKKEVVEVISAASEGNGKFLVRSTLQSLSISFSDFEDLLFKQFPHIYLFNEKYSLRETLPERIAPGWEANNDAFETIFVNYLGSEEVDQFLRSNDPDERERLLSKLQAQIEVLTEKVNQHRSSTANSDLLEIRLHEKNGIQITIQTDGKKSYYSHLSDNTKFLFAYHLYHETNKISGDILLFDEPSNGFHPTAQEFILNFLKQLSSDGNLVVVCYTL